MERLTNKKEADAQRKSYERRLKQGYPRNIPEERFLKLAAYEDAEEEGRWVALPPKTQDVDFMRIFELITADGDGRAIMLPCKVGSTVYWIPDLTGDVIREDTVGGICVYGGDRIRVMLPNLKLEPIYPNAHLFFTREEAEAALKGAKTDG